MKAIILLLILSVSVKIFSQDSIDYITTSKYFKDNGIKLNALNIPAGYNVFYNCDSMLFVRGNFSDTIKIWTPGVEWAHTLEEFCDVIKNPEYGKTVYAKEIMADGRILVASSMETIFIFRNDSLYQVEDTVSKPQEYYSMMVDNMLGKLDKATFTRKTDSIDNLYADKHAFVPKLIFAKSMFSNGKKKVKLPGKVNYEKDEIELEKEWIENNRRCYLVRINNQLGKEKTSYAYAINEDIKFIWWEGCSTR